MSQKQHIMHGRDHLPNGADPIPGLCVDCADAPPVGDDIEDTVDETTSQNLDAHWYRFREADYPLVPAEDRMTPDVVTNDDSYGMYFSVNNRGWHEIEQTLQPGPTAGSLAILRQVEPEWNADNIWHGQATLSDLPIGTGKNFTVVGWFKFTDLADYDIFNWSGSPISDYLTMNTDGSLTLYRDGTAFSSAAGIITTDTWLMIAYVLGGDRVKVYVNPGAPTPTDYNPSIGTTFPFQTPMAMETWGLHNGDYTAAALAERLTSAGFTSVAVQLNYVAGAGHSAYITQLTADVATLKAAGLQVIGWGEVDGTTGADLTTTDVDGWLPQIEGDSQRTAVITALGAGVGSGLPKAVITNMGGLDDASEVAAVETAGIDSFAIEVYAGDGFSDVTAKLAHGSSVGMDMQNTIPFLGTYRGETPDSYTSFDEGVIPNYGIYNIPQTSDAAWTAFGNLNSGTLQLSAPVIDETDPTSDSGGALFLIGTANPASGSPATDGAFNGYITEVQVYERTLSSSDLRDSYLSGSYGDTGTVPPQEQIPPGGLTPPQIAPGADGQHLVTTDGVATWEDQPAIPANLNDLTDVDTTGYADGEVLTWDSGTSKWVSEPPSAGTLDLDDLTDVTISSPADNDVLTYDSGSGLWGAAAAAAGSGGAAPDALWLALGFKAITGDPRDYAGSSGHISGQLNGMAVWIPSGRIVTNIGVLHVTAGATITTAKAAIYNTSGSLLASSANTVTMPANTGWRYAALSSAWTCPSDGLYYLAFLYVGSSLGSYATLAAGTPWSAEPHQSPAAGTPYIYWKMNSQTDLPSTATFGVVADKAPLMFAT